MRLRVAAILPFILLTGFVSAGEGRTEEYLGRKDGLSSNDVNCVMQDSRGFLWIGTDAALDLYDGQSFQSFPTPTLSLAEAGGVIWAGTRHGLYIYNPSEGNYSVFRGTTCYGVNIVRDVNAITVTGDNHIWVGTQGQGLFVYNIGTGELSQQSIHTPFVNRIAEDPSGCVMVESTSGHLDLYNADGTFLRHLNTILPPDDHSIVDAEGTLWIPRPGLGLEKIARKQTGDCLMSLPEKNVPVSGIPLTEDSQGNIWFGAGSDLYILPFGEKEPSTQPVRFSGAIRDILASNDGIWIGTDGAGIFRYDPLTRKRVQFPITGDFCILYRLHSGKLMAGTSQGLFMYDPAKQAFETYLNRKDITILLDGEKSSEGHLVEFEVVSKSHVTALAEDPSNHLYMSTSDHGIFRKNFVTGSWEHFVFTKEGEDVIPGNKVTTMHVGKDGSIWAGTNGAGIWRIKGDMLVFSRVELPDKRLDGASITSLASDGNDRLWIGSTLGIWRFDPRDNSIISFDTSPANLIYTSTGKLLAGKKDALMSITPEMDLLPAAAPPVVIRGMTVGDSLLFIPPGGRNIELPYTSNSFSIRLACLSYVNPSAKHYRWRLIGFDRDWTNKSGLSTAGYTKIPPGKYRFEVEGSEDVLDIVIRPPWWRTKAAITAWVLLAFMVVIFLILYLRRSIRRRYARIMKEREEAREKELYKQRIRFFIGLVHEIRTPLTLIRLQHEKEAQGTDDSITRNLDYMQETINRILTYDKNSSDGVKMLLTRVNLGDLASSVISNFTENALGKGKTLTLDLPETPIMVKADEDQLTKIINNLLSNAIKYARRRIVVKVASESADALLTVVDDGPGVRKEERKKIFEMFHTDPEDKIAQASGMGVGLAYARQLAKAHGGDVTLDDTLQGASFTLRIPLLKEVLPSAEETAIEASSSGTTILVAEDNAELLETLSSELSPYYNIFTAPDGKSAYEILENNAVDIVVSDVMMPVMDGLELCRKIKSDINYSHIPVILLTAKVSLPDKTEGMESGADAYVEKPFSFRQLKAQIDNLLRLRESFRKAVSAGESLPSEVIHSPEADFINAIDEAIEKQISEESFSIEALAYDMAMSSTNFFRKFKALTGDTPNEYLKNYRLTRAAKMLRQGARVNEAAIEVGFTSSSYFAKCFKARFGVLPKDYLKTPPDSASF